ncbi:helix-turn-helix domain-containing protein [Heyndrickxia sporothermodurans]|uniref:DNA methyltransferase n=1 Tax=Bacillaceae TaxID=186817 RepID=UPI001AEE56DE|nr:MULTISPECIES: DNA methyltransferase [Bacillaceae]MEB6551079.1 helix-turn-helix domain-containing protein [Heyndrickxia sporothermodurans]MED3781859.1 DNA methyltransferase [Heyndrickxia sporothermodurans]QTR71177.1 helix-turn-helix domain-containing protein [Bacillus cytotoxicus]
MVNKTVEKSTELYTVKKAANYLGVSPSTIYRAEEKGLLKAIKTPGGQRRFEKAELENYKEESKNIKAPQTPSISLKQANFEQLELIEGDENEEQPTDIDSKIEDETDDNSNGIYDPRNKLNNLTGKEWLPETKSFWFQKGLGSKHPHAQIEKQHPAPFSFQDVGRLIAFFTKEGDRVLDPFLGVGSTLKAAALLNRQGTGIELSPKWSALAKERLDFEVGEGTSEHHTIITGDSRIELKKFNDDLFDFMVTSPPYWAILNKKADHKVKKERVENNLATNYSEDDQDLGNIPDYDEFLEILVNSVFVECARVIKPDKYMAIVVSDFRNKSEFISFHSDLIQQLNKKRINDDYILTLQGVKVLIQNHKSLLPYGYPFAYVENIHHQYILIFRKTKSKRKN